MEWWWHHFGWFNQRHVSDIWATLAEAVGIHSSKGGSSGPADDPVAAAVGLPAVDSISFWQQAIGANTTAARAELLINGVYYDNTGLKLFGGAGDVSTTCAASVSIWVQVFSFFFLGMCTLFLLVPYPPLLYLVAAVLLYPTFSFSDFGILLLALSLLPGYLDW